MKTRDIKELKEHYETYFELCPELCKLYLDKIREYEKTSPEKTIQRKGKRQDMSLS